MVVEDEVEDEFRDKSSCAEGSRLGAMSIGVVSTFETSACLWASARARRRRSNAAAIANSVAAPDEEDEDEDNAEDLAFVEEAVVSELESEDAARTGFVQGRSCVKSAARTSDCWRNASCRSHLRMMYRNRPMRSFTRFRAPGIDLAASKSCDLRTAKMFYNC